MLSPNDAKLEINQYFCNFQVEEFKNLVTSHKRLAFVNKKLMYTFHLIQSAGIFITTISQSYNDRSFIWLGIGLNVIASLLRAYESMNEEIIKKALVNIQHIRESMYVDDDNENHEVDVEHPEQM